MRAAPALICLIVLAAATTAARAQTTQTPKADGARAQAETSPAQAEAARLNDELVKLYAAGKYAEALPLAERAVELREKELGRTHTLVAGALLNLAAVERSLGKLEEAKGHYKRAASILEKAGDEAARPLINAVEGEARLEPDVYNALELHKRALALKEKTLGPDAPEVARSLFPLGHLSDLLGRRDDAERYFKRFIEVEDKNKAGADDDVAVAYVRLACLADKEGKSGESLSYTARANEVYKAVASKRGPIEGGIINGKAISKPQPAYPAEAKRVRAEGTVEVETLIGEDGSVLSACARGDVHPALKLASEFAAYSARFTPTLVNGEPSKVRGVITYRFVLR